MARTRSLRNTTIIITTILLVFLAAALKRPAVSLLWRRARHATSLTRPYRAPMIDCQSPDDIIKGSYSIWLHPGSSLEMHKQTVGKQGNLDSKFTHIFPGTAPCLGLVYTVKNLDDLTLDAVRADVLVDRILCDAVPILTDEEPEEIIRVSDDYRLLMKNPQRELHPPQDDPYLPEFRSHRWYEFGPPFAWAWVDRVRRAFCYY